MSYRDTLNNLGDDAEQFEQTYQEAVQGGHEQAFKETIAQIYAETPHNLLYAAWFYRLKQTVVHHKQAIIDWAWLIPLALINGLLFWWLSDFEQFMIEVKRPSQSYTYELLPYLLLFASPISATLISIYLTLPHKRPWHNKILIAIVPPVAGLYAFFIYPQTGPIPYQEQYIYLTALHLPLASWAAVGLILLWQNRDTANRFSFLIKSLELIIVGAMFAAAIGLFTAITAGLFDALNIQLSDLMFRLLLAGLGGLIPLTATVIVYNPALLPSEQSFNEGVSKLIPMLTRVMLPLTFIVLLIYLAFIPFNFWEPFDNRDVLLIYNGMLFAVVGLLVAATPLKLTDLSPTQAHWLRRSIRAVAALALLVSLYALAAILYRTTLGRITPNRLAFIGWNLINIFILTHLLIKQTGATAETWHHKLHKTYQLGTAAYATWAIVMILTIPWLFSIDDTKIETLPATIQHLYYEQPEPILLRCYGEPHIYLLDNGEKRWIENMEVFEQRGYVWQDVKSVGCNTLEDIPNGLPIPPDAGSPSQL